MESVFREGPNKRVMMCVRSERSVGRKLVYSAKYGWFDAVEYLVSDKGADPCANGCEAAWVALEMGHLYIVHFFVYDCRVKLDRDGIEKRLDVLLGRGYLDVLEFLESSGLFEFEYRHIALYSSEDNVVDLYKWFVSRRRVGLSFFFARLLIWNREYAKLDVFMSSYELDYDLVLRYFLRNIKSEYTSLPYSLRLVLEKHMLEDGHIRLLHDKGVKYDDLLADTCMRLTKSYWLTGVEEAAIVPRRSRGLSSISRGFFQGLVARRWTGRTIEDSPHVEVKMDTSFGVPIETDSIASDDYSRKGYAEL